VETPEGPQVQNASQQEPVQQPASPPVQQPVQPVAQPEQQKGTFDFIGDFFAGILKFFGLG
jgi:hypothetical protein